MKRAFLIFGGIVLCIALLYGGHALIAFIEDAADLRTIAAPGLRKHPAILVILLAYVLLLAVPFVPGTELGLFLLLLFGADIAPLVYLATVAGMTLAFTVGCLVPQRRLVSLFQTLGMHRAAVRFAREDAAPEPPTKPWAQFLLRHRYIALALLINTPGNTILGGGGGIAMTAGISRLYRPRAFLLTVLIAVAPVPLTILLLPH